MLKLTPTTKRGYKAVVRRGTNSESIRLLDFLHISTHIPTYQHTCGCARGGGGVRHTTQLLGGEHDAGLVEQTGMSEPQQQAGRQQGLAQHKQQTNLVQ